MYFADEHCAFRVGLSDVIVDDADRLRLRARINTSP